MTPTGDALSQVLDLPTSPAKIMATAANGAGGSDMDLKFQMVCLLLALGVPTEAICKKTNTVPAFVQAVQRSDAGCEHILRMQNALYPDPKVRIKKMVHMALDAKQRILLTGTDTLKDKVATDILDRDMGKATQVVENRSIDIAVGDIKQLDRSLEAAELRLKQHEELEARLKAARKISPAASK